MNQIALERELSQLTEVNKVIGNLISTIQNTNKDIHKVNDSINHTNDLIFKWVQIISQTSFTKDIINNSNWNGEDIQLDEKLIKEAELKRQLAQLESENNDLNEKLLEKKRKL